jgi:hypothetical protein
VGAAALAAPLSAARPAFAWAGGSTLSAGQELQAGQDLVSSGGQHTLVMQTDGNLVVYGNGCVIWASNTTGTGSSNYLAMQGDGNLVVYTGTSHPVWAAGASSADRLCTSATMSAGKYLHSPSGQVITPKVGLASIPVYGATYPELSAYPPAVPMIKIVKLGYTIPAGQEYPVMGTVPTDYYYAATINSSRTDDHTVIIGKTAYFQISFNHRRFFVRTSDVMINNLA